MAQQDKPAERPQQQQQQAPAPAQPGGRPAEGARSPQQGGTFSDWAAI